MALLNLQKFVVPAVLSSPMASSVEQISCAVNTPIPFAGTVSVQARRNDRWTLVSQRAPKRCNDEATCRNRPNSGSSLLSHLLSWGMGK